MRKTTAWSATTAAAVMQTTMVAGWRRRQAAGVDIDAAVSMAARGTSAALPTPLAREEGGRHGEAVEAGQGTQEQLARAGRRKGEAGARRQGRRGDDAGDRMEDTY